MRLGFAPGTNVKISEIFWPNKLAILTKSAATGFQENYLSFVGEKSPKINMASR
jgi:hypothetical protein